MQLVANQQLVRNRVRLGIGFHLSALAVFAVGQTQLRRWGPRNRQDEQLGQAIRSLDDRYKLYAFLSPSLPDYVLVSPGGVHVLIVRQEAGQVTCVRDRWSKSSGSRIMGLFGPSLGNPSADGARQLHKLRELLGERGMQDVPTSSLVVFTNPKAQLRIEGCAS